MKTFIVILLIIFTSFTYAEADLDEKCIRETENFGGQNLISTSCENWMIKHADLKRITAVYELYSWKRASLLKSPKGVFVISGPNTLLNEIMDIQFNSTKEVIAILNQSSEKRQILIFNSYVTGDVAPRAVIEGPEVSLIKSVRFGDGIIGINDKKEWVWDFSKDSRVLGDLAPTEKNDSIWSLIKFE